MSTENENTENTVAEGVAGISLQENPADAEWEEENEEELDSFITEDQKASEATELQVLETIASFPSNRLFPTLLMRSSQAIARPV